jgi:hypothetical protein
MNSKIYVIIGCIILILVFVIVIILLLIKHKHNSTPKPKYIALNNNPTNKIQSCFTYDNTGYNEDLTKLLCDNDDACKGYYIFSGQNEGTDYKQFLPFTSSPVKTPDPLEECFSDDGFAEYTTYKSKVDNYTTPHNNPITGVCSISHTPRFIQKGVNGEDTIQKMCDKITDCNGYYKHSTKPYYVASTSQKIPDDFNIDDCCDSSDDEDFDSSNFPIFMKKNT